MDLSWMAPAILAVLVFAVAWNAKAVWVKVLAGIIAFGLAIATVQAFFRQSNWLGILVLALLVLAYIVVRLWRRRRRQQRDQQPTEHHHHHHHETN